MIRMNREPICKRKITNREVEREIRKKVGWISIEKKGKVKLPYKMHKCGNGHKGKIIELPQKKIRFCQFCGKELKKGGK